MKYKVTAFSNWIKPTEYFVDTADEAKELRKELQDSQFLVEIEEINEEN